MGLICLLVGIIIGGGLCFVALEVFCKKVKIVELSDEMEHKEGRKGLRLRVDAAMQLQNEIARCEALKVGEPVDGKRKVSLRVVLE